MPNKTVKVLRSIQWAINPPNPGEYSLIEGETRNDLPDHIIEQMLASDTDWVEVLKKGSQPEAGESRGIHVMEDVSDIRATLMEIVDNAANKTEAKAALEIWGKDNLGIDIDKRRSLETVTGDLIAEYEEQNGR